MCNPTAVLAMQGAGAATSAAGAYYSAKGEKIALQGQANLADNNARISELAAQSAIRQGQKAEQSVRLNTAKIKSSQRASMAANGIDITNLGPNDTATNILTTTDVMGEIDANTVAANAARTAWGYRTQGVNYQNEALLKRSTAGAINPLLRTGTTLLTGATDVAKGYYTFDKLGAFSGGA
jgi:hypothetical protein